MPNLLNDEVFQIRKMLGGPLPNAPSYEDIVAEIEAEYQNATNVTNNTGNAWAVDWYTLTTTADTYRYQIETDADDFYKPLNVVTVPDDLEANPEYPLEFVEVEHMPKEWGWLSSSKGQLFYSSHSANFIGIYRKMGDAGEEIWCEIRPVPDRVESYKILYQVGNWWSKVYDEGTEYGLPQPEYRHYFRALIAQNLLPKSKWSYDDKANAIKRSEYVMALQNKVVRYKEQYDNHIASLVNSDVVRLSTWGEENVIE